MIILQYMLFPSRHIQQNITVCNTLLFVRYYFQNFYLKSFGIDRVPILTIFFDSTNQ